MVMGVLGDRESAGKRVVAHPKLTAQVVARDGHARPWRSRLCLVTANLSRREGAKADSVSATLGAGAI